MASKFEKTVKSMLEAELGGRVHPAVVSREIEGMCSQFWSIWEGAGPEQAVRRMPDVALHLMYRQPAGETRTRIGRLLASELTLAPVEEVVLPNADDYDLWERDVLDAWERTPFTARVLPDKEVMYL
jgi:hypothetical protein